ncbi:2,3-dihydro-2,3-dihydroxybenzoate dehydrogenase OS=Streptomyces glaucescens OX=1907 GN=dhbA PE=3 SV=1 [Streptomyces glaucescens]
MQERIALVTGAAGGIGEAVVRALAAHGARVVAVDRNAERLREITKSVGEDGGLAEAFVADVTSSADVEALVEDVEATVGPSTTWSTARACCGWARPGS